MTEPPNKSSPHQYSLFHFITLSPKGGILVYMNLYLKRAGLNDSQLGTIAAIFSFMSIISSPIWGIIADSVTDMRRAAGHASRCVQKRIRRLIERIKFGKSSTLLKQGFYFIEPISQHAALSSVS